MKLPVLLALALTLAACEKAIFSPDATPAPSPPSAPSAPTTTPRPASPTPKPGAWMKDSKSALDKSGKLGEKAKK